MDKRIPILEAKVQEVKQHLAEFASTLQLVSNEKVSIEVRVCIRKDGRAKPSANRITRAVTDVIDDELWDEMLRLPITRKFVNLIKYSRRLLNPTRRVRSLERVGFGPAQIDYLNMIFAKNSVRARLWLVERGRVRRGWSAYQKCHYKFYRVK